MLTKKAVVCSSCGARNPASESRCRVCTALLVASAHVSDQEFNRALYSRNVSQAKRQRSSSLVIILGLLLALTVNGVWLQLGPSWLHFRLPGDRGSDWKTQSEIEGVEFRMPGVPIERSAGTAGEMMTVVLDDGWHAALDLTTTTPAELTDSERNRVGTIAVAYGAPLSAPGAVEIEGRVQGMFPGAALADTRIETLSSQSSEVAVRLSGTLNGYPAQGRTSTVEVLQLSNSHGVAVAATVTERSSLGDAHAYLAEHLRLTA